MSSENFGSQHAMNKSSSISIATTVIFFLALLGLLVIGILFFLYTPNPGTDVVTTPNQIPTASVEDSALEGKIYISARPMGSNRVELYTYDLATGAFDTLLTGEPDKIRQTAVANPDGSAFSYFELTEYKKEYNLYAVPDAEIPWGLYIYNSVSGEKNFVRSIPYAINSPRMAMWSPDASRLAYTYWFMQDDGSDPEGFWRDPEMWRIISYQINSDFKFIKKTDPDIVGTSPHWSPDGQSIIFQRRDGIYQKIIGSSSEPVRVVSNPSGTSSNIYSKIGLSRDKSLMAWTFVDFAEVNPSALNLYRVTSWNPFTVELFKTLEPTESGVRYYWPVFSADGKHIVVQRIIRGLDNEVFDSSLWIYDVQTGGKRELLDLSGYDPDALFISDWR